MAALIEDAAEQAVGKIAAPRTCKYIKLKDWLGFLYAYPVEERLKENDEAEGALSANEHMSGLVKKFLSKLFTSLIESLVIVTKIAEALIEVQENQWISLREKIGSFKVFLQS